MKLEEIRNGNNYIRHLNAVRIFTSFDMSQTTEDLKEQKKKSAIQNYSCVFISFLEAIYFNLGGKASMVKKKKAISNV